MCIRDSDGTRWNDFKALNIRHPKRRAREAAIWKLAEFRPLPENARIELITLLRDGNGDFDSGDGIYSSRSAICYTLGRSANHWSACQAMLDLLRKRALDPNLDNTSDIKWFNKKFAQHRGSSTGPGAIVQGLLFAAPDFRDKIRSELKSLQQELNDADVSSEWALEEIGRGLRRIDEDSMEVYLELDVDRLYLSLIHI